MQQLRILGTRGIPAGHGGFETFAEKLSLHLAGRDWKVTVYCQAEGEGAIYEDQWNKIRRVHIPVRQQGALGTIVFDFKAVLHARREPGVALTLGYNTALFTLLLRLRGIRNLINMDGIEWKREKWRWYERAWLYLNERIGSRLAHTMIADHPLIRSHLSRHSSLSRIEMIPYGADVISSASTECLERYGVEPGNYALIIARPEPENSILEMVQAFSSLQTEKQLVVLGEYDGQSNRYHQQVMKDASSNVLFPGAIYNQDDVAALRYHAWIYMHGHRVGGTNPSLVEALGAGCAVLAHDNGFNRWVAEDAAQYFSDVSSCIDGLKMLEESALLEKQRRFARERHGRQFTWSSVLESYQHLLIQQEQV